MLSLRAFLWGPLAAICMVALWIIAVEKKVILRDPVAATSALILANDGIIQNHLRAWGELPDSLNDLRLFARQNSDRYSSFDIWGERLEYLRLGDGLYTIRSFGADGIQNRPGTPVNPGVAHLGPMVEKGLTYNPREGVAHPRPAVVLYAGADDSAGKWHAQIYFDPRSGAKRLLVRSHANGDLFMVAPHDGVEEFLWFPDEERIVFSASHSDRYEDGLFVWDLKSDESYNLFSLGTEESDGPTGNRQTTRHVALAYVTATTPVEVGVFTAPSTILRLDPKAFFNRKNLHVFVMDKKIKHIKPAENAAQSSTLHDKEFLGSLTLAEGGGGNSLQKAWLALPMGGDWEKSMLAWQEFATQHGKTQLGPYAVLGLAMFYAEAAKVAGVSSKDGKIFSSFSVELGNSLSTMVAAPSYVRAIGAWMGDPGT
jgi:hypothetical protein